MHQSFSTFVPVSSESVQAGARVHRLVPTFTYKTNVHGIITGHKERHSFPGNHLKRGLHYDERQLAVHSADRAAVRLVMALVVHMGMQINHVDISAAFLHEAYQGAEPLYVHFIPDFDGSTVTNRQIHRVTRNIYGTRHAPRIYTDGIQRHLITS